MKIGFIGLGAMGLPMTRRLLAAGHTVAVASRSRPPIDAAIAAGALDGRDARGVVEKSDVTLICVPFSPDVGIVLDTIGPAMRPGKILVDCSTIEPDAEVAFHTRVAATGASYLEAPLSGGPLAARDGTLAVMAGGAAGVFEKVRPALEPFAREIMHMGRPGSGQSAKLCNNLIHAAQNLAVAEACALAARAGVDIARFRKIVMHSTGDCTAIRNRIPVEGIFADSPASNGWLGFPTDMMIKEMDMVLRLGDRQDVPLASTALVRELLRRASAAGLGHEDFSVMGKLLRDPIRHSDVHRWLKRLSGELRSGKDS